MDQLKRLLAGLTLKQKLTIAAAAAAVASALYFGIQWNKERDLRPLYTGLAPEDAGAVVEKLRAANIRYKVEDNGTILVPSALVAEQRLEMAASGLPKSGRVGFELFDKTNLGTSEFAEHINYRRALEGELERSVMALAEVERARVHVTFAKESIYLDRREPAKASVLVKLRPGRRLQFASVQAIQHLTASAVEGLEAPSVSVLDMNGTLLSKPRSSLDEESGATSAMLDYRQAVEKDYLNKIRATLDPLLGPEKYRVGVSAECDFTSGEQSEEVFDPSRSVMATSTKTEDISGVQGSGGVPGAASNLPRPAPRAASTAGGVSRKTESITFQTSRTVKRLELPRGSLRRLSVAVLVDQNLRWEGSGPNARRILEPPPPERLKVVKDVVAGVIGFQQERGDQLLVETLPFEATLLTAAPGEPQARPSAPPGGFTLPKWLEPLMKTAPLPVWIGALAALLIVFALIVFLLLKKLFRKKVKVQAAPAQPALTPAAHHEQVAPAATRQQFEEKAQALLAANEADRERAEQEALASLKLPPNTKKTEVLRKVIAEDTKKDPARMAQLVRTWLNERPH